MQTLQDFDAFVKANELESLFPANWREEIADWQSSAEEDQAFGMVKSALERAAKVKPLPIGDSNKIDDEFLAAMKLLFSTIDKVRAFLNSKDDTDMIASVPILDVARVFSTAVDVYSTAYDKDKKKSGEFRTAIESYADAVSDVVGEMRTSKTGPPAKQLVIVQPTRQHTWVGFFVNWSLLIGSTLYTFLTWLYNLQSTLRMENLGIYRHILPQNYVAFIYGYFNVAVDEDDATFLQWLLSYVAPYRVPTIGRVPYTYITRGFIPDLENVLRTTYDFNLGSLLNYNPALVALFMFGTYVILQVIQSSLTDAVQQRQRILILRHRDGGRSTDDDGDEPEEGEDRFMDPD